MTNIDEIVPPTQVGSENILHTMFFLQKQFGDHCFAKNKITDNEGNILTFDKIFQEFQEGKFGANDLPNVWVKKFHECMVKELEEVEEMLPWKHWSKATIGEEPYPDLPEDQRINMLRIELVDIWHFLMSAMMCLGMGPEDLHDLYIKKNQVNINRQDSGYNTARKTEEDNLAIASS